MESRGGEVESASRSRLWRVEWSGEVVGEGSVGGERWKASLMWRIRGESGWLGGLVVEGKWSVMEQYG